MGVVGLLKKGLLSFNALHANKQIDIHVLENVHVEIDIHGLTMFQQTQTRIIQTTVAQGTQRKLHAFFQRIEVCQDNYHLHSTLEGK